jgi:hypothetical protein
MVREQAIETKPLLPARGASCVCSIHSWVRNEWGVVRDRHVSLNFDQYTVPHIRKSRMSGAPGDNGWQGDSVFLADKRNSDR